MTLESLNVKLSYHPCLLGVRDQVSQHKGGQGQASRGRYMYKAVWVSVATSVTSTQKTGRTRACNTQIFSITQVTMPGPFIVFDSLADPITESSDLQFDSTDAAFPPYEPPSIFGR